MKAKNNINEDLEQALKELKQMSSEDMYCLFQQQENDIVENANHFELIERCLLNKNYSLNGLKDVLFSESTNLAEAA